MRPAGGSSLGERLVEMLDDDVNVDRFVLRQVGGIEPQADPRHPVVLAVEVTPQLEHVLVTAGVPAPNRLETERELNAMQRPGLQYST